jgi:hypothetical protein
MLGIPNPLGRGLGGAAALLDTLRVLPEIAENTAAMATATSTLPEIERKLAEIEESVRQMDARMATIEATMPLLIEAVAPLEDVARLTRRIPGRNRNER